MTFNDLGNRKAIKVYAWKTKREAGVLTAELFNSKNKLVGIMISCPDVYGVGRYRIITDIDKTSVNTLSLDDAVSVIEYLAGVKGAQVINIPKKL